MKKLSLFAAIVATAALAVAASTSAAVTQNEVVPFAQIVFVPCANGGAGEFVLIEGNLHILMTFTINGNNVSGKIHFQPQGVKGTGLTTGDTYNATGVTQEHFEDSLQNGLFTDTFVNNFKIIGQGPDNNLLIHQTVHITINADGEVTAEVDNTTVECR
jgi:hypothetical protein